MRPGALLAHLFAFSALVVVTFVFLHAAADDDTWYRTPPDPGDDDGYLIATIQLMLYVIPIELLVYVSALLVARRTAPKA